jgi:hypothetical protein
MAKLEIRIKNVDKLKKDLESIGPELFNNQFKLFLGRLIRDIIYKRTKAGYGVSDLKDNPGIGKQKLAPLSQSYKLQRAGKLSFYTNKLGQVIPYTPKSPPRLGEFATANKSNLTLSGQMLKAIAFQATKQGIRVYINDNARSGSDLSNAEVAEFVQEDGTTRRGGIRPGRPFFNLTDDELTILIREIEKELRKITRRFS